MTTYKISTGELFLDDTCIGKGYAGHPPHVNDVTATGIHNYGPLPVGTYDIGDPVDLPESVGAFALPLTPHSDNVMLGRGGFFIHGANGRKDIEGRQLSSDGCPVVEPRTVREQIWADPLDHLLAVIA